MGYYSDYVGEYTFTTDITTEQKKAVYKWFKSRFGWYECIKDNTGIDIDNHNHIVEKDGKKKYYGGCLYFNTNDDAVYPIYSNMKGYDFNEHLYEIVTYLKSIGLELEGDVERSGEETGDLEIIRVCGDKVLSFVAKIDYDNPVVVNETEAQKRAKFDAMFNK